MNESNDQNSITKLEDAVEDVLIENKLQAVLYFSKIQKNWAVLVGEPLAAKTSPVKMTGKTLFVEVEDAAYSHHLRYYEKQMLDLIASPEICGEGVVNRIKFRVGSPASFNKRDPEPENNPSSTTMKPPTKISDAAKKTSAQIEDRKLKNSFARYMSTHSENGTDEEK